VTFFISN